MYDAIIDAYCYEGTTILKNIPDLRDQSALDAFEAVMTTQRSDEPLPGGNLDVAHYYAIHRHLFQDVYLWAGEVRSVRISKGGNTFCYPENIEQEMQTLFSSLNVQNHLQGLSEDDFVKHSAHFLSTLNAIHPFREGNGRTQTSFLLLVADHAGHALDVNKLAPERFMDAVIASFGGNEALLTVEIKKLLA